MPTLKKPLAIRIDPELLAAARDCATHENRTLTNFIETVLRRHIEEVRQSRRVSTRPDPGI